MIFKQNKLNFEKIMKENKEKEAINVLRSFIHPPILNSIMINQIDGIKELSEY